MRPLDDNLHLALRGAVHAARPPRDHDADSRFDALLTVLRVFRSFSKYNPIHKIEDLQDTMEELTEDLSDVTNLLSSGTIEFDDDALEQELIALEQEPEGAIEDLPVVPTHKPMAVRVPQELPV